MYKYSGTSALTKLLQLIKSALDGKVPITRKVNNKALTADISLTAADVGALGSTATAAAATKLAAGRTIQTNLASTTAVAFDGTAAITPGVKGTLPIANGGTNATTAPNALKSLGAVPLAGGTMTGALTVPSMVSNGNITLAAGQSIVCKSSTRNRAAITFYEGDANGSGITIGEGGRTIIGGGESAVNVRGTFEAGTDGDESMHVAADSYVYVHTNCNTIADKKTTIFNRDGTLTLAAAPTANMHAATKQYVDTAVANKNTIPTSGYVKITTSNAGDLTTKSGTVFFMCNGNTITQFGAADQVVMQVDGGQDAFQMTTNTGHLYVRYNDSGVNNATNWGDFIKVANADDAAPTAVKLKTARTIALKDGATGTATAFDGSTNISIPVTGLDMSKATAGTLPIARGGTGQTTAAGVRNALGLGNTTGALPVANGGTGLTNLVNTSYTTQQVRGIAFASSAPSSVPNGEIVLVYA